jgi:hypothetical protein
MPVKQVAWGLNLSELSRRFYLMLLRPLALAFLALAACNAPVSGSSPDATAPATDDDAATLINLIRRYYAPLEWRERRERFAFDTLARQATEAYAIAADDAARMAVLKHLVAQFQDGHLVVSPPVPPGVPGGYWIPARVANLQGRAVLTSVDAELEAQGVRAGDELLAIDGRRPADLLQEILRYEAFGSEGARAQLIYRVLVRPWFIPSLVPTETTAHLVLERADGTSYEIDVPWRTEGDLRPYKMQQVTEKAAYRTAAVDARYPSLGGTVLSTDDFKIGWSDTTGTSRPASDDKTQLGDKSRIDLYAYRGKHLALLRIGTWDGAWSSIAGGMANLLRLLRDGAPGIPAADALIIDQTGNPGGRVCEDFLGMIAPTPPKAAALFANRDDGWSSIAKLQAGAAGDGKAFFIDWATAMEPLHGTPGMATRPFYWGGRPRLQAVPQLAAPWTKPLLILQDELSASCADVFSLIVKGNGLGRLFGATTAGLVGNAADGLPSKEPAARVQWRLPHSGAIVTLTRGLYQLHDDSGNYPEEGYAEGRGIAPDVPYELGIEDVREGYLRYFEAFSDEAVRLIEAGR